MIKFFSTNYRNIIITTMIRQFFPVKDATIYEFNPLLNTGLDQILELKKTDTNTSRILIQFDINNIQQYIQDNNIQDFTCKLRLASVDSRELPLDYTVYVHPVTQPWSMGTGKKDIRPIIKNGANWIYRTDVDIWNGTSASFSGNVDDFYNLYNTTSIISASYYGEMNGTITGLIHSGSLLIEPNYLHRYFLTDTIINEELIGRFTGNVEIIYTGSIVAALSGSADISYFINDEGGSYNTNIVATQSFVYEESDLYTDVTNIIVDWLSGSYDNNGFLIKLSDTEESKSNQTELQFYSKDTHTIYPPKLDLYWDDSTFVPSASINNYTMSYVINTYHQSTIPVDDLSFTYINFGIPVLPRNATYTTNDTWSYQTNHIISPTQDYIKTYINEYIDGNFIANVNGIFSGSISGSISGSNVSGGYIEYSGSMNIPVNGKLIATMSGNFLGYINGNIYNRTTAYEYFITGSRIYTITESIDLKPLSKANIILYIKNPLLSYVVNSINEIRVTGRERFPAKTYWSRNTYADIKYLPSTTYYSIKDGQTQDVVIPFDDIATKLSCDGDGNYFILDTTGFQTERMYRIVFKVVRNNMIQYFDDNFYFKVVR